GVVLRRRERARDELGDEVHFRFAHAAAGDRGCADADPAGDHRRAVGDAGVPTRIPLATIGGFWSKGIAFLLTVMPALPSAASAALPVMPLENTSTSIRWLSVPPLTRRKPSSVTSV